MPPNREPTLRRGAEDANAGACSIRIEDEALARAGRVGGHGMAAAAGVRGRPDRVVRARADHAQVRRRPYPEVPGVGAWIEVPTITGSVWVGATLKRGSTPTALK